MVMDFWDVLVFLLLVLAITAIGAFYLYKVAFINVDILFLIN